MTEDRADADTADRLAAIRAQMAGGEYLQAYDAAEQALAAAPRNPEIRRLAVLALARAGALGQAIERFDAFALDEVRTEETLGLQGRLFKDAALAAAGAERRIGLMRAIAAYRQAFEIDGGYFPAINVATLSAIAGDMAAAEAWAGRALPLATAASGYYAKATEAEACLLLHRPEAAARALAAAVAAPDAGFAARSTTLRQLRLVCATLGLSADLLEPLRPPAVAHFCGHIVAPVGAPGRFPAAQTDRVAADIAAVFDRRPISRAVGSLAAGADILAAEAALAAGAELDLILPFDLDEFIEISVGPAGADWVPRMQACLDRARQVHFVTEDAYLGDDELFGYASEYALGLASVQARWLATDVYQIAVWDGDAGGPDAVAGASHDVALGKRLGLDQEIVAVTPAAPPRRPKPRSVPADAAATRLTRVRRSMLFGDLKGFSKLTDAQLPLYVEHVLGACAGVLARYGAHLTFRNTWGDGLFLVFDDIAAAADCAFALQDAIGAVDRTGLGLPETLGLRLGFHYGPVFETRDPVLDRQNCFGFHVSRAARVEPITPEGSVYATEQTAAAIALARPERYRAEYVGRVPLAKGYGSFPMYHLRAAPV